LTAFRFLSLFEAGKRIVYAMVFVVILIFVVLLQLVFLVLGRQRKAATLQNLRATWGQPRTPAFETEFDRIRLYDRLKDRDGSIGLDDKTWTDLDLDLVFQYVDRTSSRVGQQFLFHLLRKPHFKEEPLLSLERTIQRFYTVNLREKLQIELHRLNHKDALFLPYLFLEELPQFSALQRFVFLALPVATLAAVVGAFFSPSFRVLLIMLAMSNMMTSLYYRRRLEPFLQPLRLLNVLINTARNLAYQLDGNEISEHTEKLKEEVDNLSGLKRTTAVLSVERESDDAVTFIYDYLNKIFLIDLNCYGFAVDELRKKREHVTAIYERLGYLDAAISIASLRQGNPNVTTPAFTETTKRCRMMGGYHPLLESPVANDLTVNGKGILLTGSNMSGKSTFIRTVGVNAVMAQTIHTCFAREYVAPFLEVKACMGAADSLLEGKSHYFSEVEGVLALIKAAQSGKQCLLLLDELFRGTNTLERVAAAKAILEYMNRGAHIVLIATHDIELVELLDLQYESHHFREIIRNEQMTFDYKLQKGTSSTRNAIAILDMFGYPKPIVNEALKVVDRLAEDKSQTPRLFGLKIPRW
jgi:DNA mismatch repair ATPase MutS